MPIWQADLTLLTDGRGRIVGITRDEQPLKYSEAITLWQRDESFRDFFIQQLADCSFLAFRLETPPITSGTADRDFEFVLLQAGALDRPADPTAFAKHFESSSTGDVLAFPNLSGDAVMIVPRGIADDSAYPHLAAFLHNGPAKQVHELWKVVGRAMEERLSDKPVWLSTAGMGVAWLHVRLDSRPKYYGHQPYRRE